MANYVKVATVDELSSGEIKRVEVEGQALALVNLDGSFFALSDSCTHVGGPLSEGSLAGEELECPWHGARFNVRTGQATEMPAVEPVATFPVKVENGQVFVLLE